MIEAKQQHQHADYWIYADGVPLCLVATVTTTVGTGRRTWTGPDWEATKARAEHIAAAMRHYQQSQEAEVTP